MLKNLVVYTFIVSSACTPKRNSSDATQVSDAQSVTTTDRFGNRSPRPPYEKLDELKQKISLHGDINKNPHYVDFVLDALTSNQISFPDLSSSNPLDSIRLVPYFDQCCTERLSPEGYPDYGACLDRVFKRVLSTDRALEKDLLVLGKGILLELSPQGRKGWCAYIRYQWENGSSQETL